MNRASSLRLRADLALVAVSAVWGCTFVIVKEAIEQVSTMLFLAIRFSLAAIALALIFRTRGTHGHWGRRKQLLAGAVVGLCLFAGYVLQTMGLRETTAAKAGFITGFYIPLVPLLGALVYRRAPRFAEVLGVLAATGGMMLLTMPSLQFDIARGDLLVLGGAVSFAFHILVLGHCSKHMSYERLAIAQIAAAALLAWSSLSWIEPVRWHPTAGVFFALGLTSLLATAFAFAVQTWAQQFTTPTRTALIFSLEPVFAWVTSFLVVGEVLNGRAMAGAALILAGILTVELKPAPRPNVI
jgi:drug/metabolite transporter (DMT)-like permease